MKPRIVKTALIALGIIVSFLLAELVLRIATPATFMQTAYKNQRLSWIVFDPILGWTNQAGYENADIRINSLGFLGEEVSKTKPPGTIRIVSLGDSGTFGIWESWPGLIEFDNYPDMLRDALELDGVKRVQVINAGVLGYSSSNALRQLMIRVLDLEPDIITARFGFNDHCLVKNPEFHVEEPSNGVVRWLLYNFHEWRIARLVARIGQKLNAGKYENQKHQVTPLEFKKNLELFIKEARARNIRLLFIDYPLSAQEVIPLRVNKFYTEYTGASNIEEMREMHNDYQAIQKSVAKVEDVPILESKDQFKELNQSVFGRNDLIHPNKRGAQLIGELLYQKIQTLGWLKENKN